MPLNHEHAYGHKLKRTQALVAASVLSIALALVVFSVFAAQSASAQSANVATDAGGAGFTPTPATQPGLRATISADGRTAVAPAGAPIEVQQAIWAANEITKKPYIYGGGHRKFKDRGYDCSGTVSYALHGAGLLASPLDSSSFLKWGAPGRGDWITVYTNPGHAYAYIAGLRLDTSGPGEKGPRWRVAKRSNKGFRARHPEGF
jgi:cell wall-associated NlpC family hydrolase